MITTYQPTRTEIAGAFQDAMARAGSTQIEVTEFGDQLFGRAMLPNFADAGPGDQFQGGVALRSCGAAVRIQPYTFRKVCRNGAIAASILDQHEVRLCGPEASPWEAQEVLSQIEQLVESCAEPNCLDQFLRHARMAQRMRPDRVLSFLSSIEKTQTRIPPHLVQSILGRFETQEDGSSLWPDECGHFGGTRRPEPSHQSRFGGIGGRIPGTLARDTHAQRPICRAVTERVCGSGCAGVTADRRRA